MTKNDETKKMKKCGIIMPIAAHPDYDAEHWKDVLTIIIEAVQETEFEPRIVSDDVAVGLIHDRIVNNIYNDEIVICDVSSKNPNVMFELGMRLAFDKPTIIIKDEKTGYSFDTGVIEHINYPSSLHHLQIVNFKNELGKRITATYKRSVDEPNYSPFLKSFGKTLVPASIKKTEIAEGKFIIEQLESLRNELRGIRQDSRSTDKNITDKRFFKNQLYKIISEYKNKSFAINDSEFIPILHREAMMRGFNISNKEVNNILDEFILDEILKSS